MRRALSCLCGLVFGCTASSDAGPTSDPEADAALCEVRAPLVDHTRWTVLGPATDPYGPGPSPRARCGGEALAVEALSGETSLSVSTRNCSWATVEQPSLVALEPGDRLHVRLWYFSLTDFDAAEAHVKLGVAGGPEAAFTLPLPSPAGLAVDDLEVETPCPAGAAVRWHVDNHGENSWNLIEVTAVRSQPCER